MPKETYHEQREVDAQLSAGPARGQDQHGVAEWTMRLVNPKSYRLSISTGLSQLEEDRTFKLIDKL